MVDVFNDSKEGVAAWHTFIEAFAGLLSLFGIFYFLRDSFQVKNKLQTQIIKNAELLKQAEQWQKETQKFTQGLSSAIDQQLHQWSLTPAEKEVALLLLKGLALKEIADIRQTSEKTTRIQSNSIYTKSGLAGRSELAAFFLEDLLQPLHPSEIQGEKL